MHVGQRIKELLNEKDISITAAAEAIGKTRQTMYDLFEKPNISTDVLLKLSNTFFIPIEAFFTTLPVNNKGNSTTANPSAIPINSKELEQWLLDRQKIIVLQEESLKWERSRQAFGFFLQKLWDNITEQRGLRRKYTQEELSGSSFSEGYEVNDENAQQAYEEIFKSYYDFGIFFETGFITNSSWKDAWERYKDRKLKEEQEKNTKKK